MAFRAANIVRSPRSTLGGIALGGGTALATTTLSSRDDWQFWLGLVVAVLQVIVGAFSGEKK